MQSKIKKYIDTLYSFERNKMKYNLKNISLILEHLDNPQNNFNSIHIAGTNGKGATASMIAAILIGQGYKTGLYTSPHILSFNERIRINGICIPDEEIIRFLECSFSFLKKIKPSFFEITTALAFEYFSKKEIDIAVVETGLGGRLDATNILSPKVTVITQISLDHQNYLGNNIYKIAEEKLGIIKRNVPVVINNTTPGLNKLFCKYIKKNNRLNIDKYFRINVIKVKNNKIQRFSIVSPKLNIRDVQIITLPVIGNYQIRNALSAILASYKYIAIQKKPFKIEDAIKSLNTFNKLTEYRCRLESLKTKSNTFILDVSHNPEGIRLALENLNSNDPIIIFGMMADKDYKSSVSALLLHSKDIIFTQPKYKRALKTKTLYDYAKKIITQKTEFNKNNIYQFTSVNKALDQATQLAKKERSILVIGSFFLVSETIRILKIQKEFY